MEDQTVSFETAKLAKEKGFPQENYYLTKDQIELLGPRIMIQSLLQKWLREIHNIHVWVSYDRGYDYPFMDCIVDLKQTNRFTTGYKKTYEKALESGLFEALKLIQNEKDNN